MRETLADRFWRKVQKTDTCWLWTASVGTHGYGQIGVGGTVVAAYRVAWELTNGPIPKGQRPRLCVCHTCDNRLCVNPSHLFLGTQADNLRDMTKKGRRVNPPTNAGVLNVNSKFTDDDIRTIRRLHSEGVSARELARVYGVWSTTIDQIVKHATWTHVS